MFGTKGLPLSGCTFGECLNQYVIDQAQGISGAKTGGNGLSGGVIAGLAVVGAILLAIILFTVWGIVVRNKARRAGPDGSLVKKSGVGMAWNNIGYEVTGTKRGLYAKTVSWLRGVSTPARPHSPRAEDGTMIGSSGGQMVLRDVCGELPPGGFCCILGPSGAGKSTLADILAGRRKAGQVEGKVSYLSDTPDRNVKIGYCDQSDVLNPTSTVLETFMFAAQLRLPENVPRHVKEERARTVLDQLGLAHIADTRVGSGEHRGISGGEMRRVSIGIELVANPDILILDEPTSGLDSVSAARIVKLLKSLTTDPENRTTIVASIHQPSSALYHAFSQVILLANGRQLYFGPAGATPAEFFAAQGRPCPPGYNIADHLLEVASDNDGGLRCGSDACLPASSSSRDSLPTTSEKELDHGIVNANGIDTGNGYPLTLPRDASRNRRVSVGKEVDLAAMSAQEQKSSRWPKNNCATTFLTQFEVLAGREWKMLKRDKTLFVAHFVVFAIVAIFAGGLYFQVKLKGY
jgi:ABC-type multidrug transport system ATPase subunit